jgi:hypothetical protein
MYSATAMSIGSRNRIFTGFSTILRTLVFTSTLISSIGAYHLSSPVALRFLSALRLRITGAYVSGRVKTVRKKQSPANRVRTQKSQRQLAGLTPIAPPTIGPSAGPANGARVKMASALPRFY